MNNRKQFIHTIFLSALCLFATDLVAEESIANVFAGIRTRANCIKELQGLGSASLVFEQPIPKTYKENDSMSGEFSWNAVLISPGAAPVKVTLHCARIKLPAMEGVSNKPWVALYAELVARQ